MTSESEDETERGARASGSDPSEGARGAPPLALRIALGAAGLLLVVGFFLPWLQLPSDTHSGLTLVFETDRDVREMVGETQRWVLLVIPVLGVGLTAVGFMGFRWAGPVAVGIGLLLLAYGVVTVVMLFFQHTAVGLWLVVGGAFLAVSAGMVGWLRARSAKVAIAVEKGERVEE